MRYVLDHNGIKVDVNTERCFENPRGSEVNALVNNPWIKKMPQGKLENI